MITDGWKIRATKMGIHRPRPGNDPCFPCGRDDPLRASSQQHTMLKSVRASSEPSLVRPVSATWLLSEATGGRRLQRGSTWRVFLLIVCCFSAWSVLSLTGSLSQDGFSQRIVARLILCEELIPGSSVPKLNSVTYP